MDITCFMWVGNKKETWPSIIRFARRSGEHIEFYLDARGSSFQIITGPADGGNYVCIPNWQAGSPLARYSDYGWNLNHIRRCIKNKVDSASIASALRYVPAIHEALDEIDRESINDTRSNS